MKLVRRAGSHADGVYATVFFVDGAAVKVFKRRENVARDHVRNVFKSEVTAYCHSATIADISQFTKNFIGVTEACRIEDRDGLDISQKYYLNYAYKMKRLNKEPQKIGDLDQEFSQYIQGLFQQAGIWYMRDCSVFLNRDGQLANVIDFAIQEYILEHDLL